MSACSPETRAGEVPLAASVAVVAFARLLAEPFYDEGPYAEFERFCDELDEHLSRSEPEAAE